MKNQESACGEARCTIGSAVSKRRFLVGGGGIVIALVATLMLSCGDGSRVSVSPEERTWHLIARSIEMTGSLVASSRLDEQFLVRVGVPDHLHVLFGECYEKLRRDVNRVNPSGRENKSVYYFLINRNLIHSADSITVSDSIRYLASAQNPVYMAFALQAEDMPAWDNIGNHYYIKSLAKSFGVSEAAVSEGVWMLLRNPPGALFEAVALMIEQNMNGDHAADHEFFFRNVIVPYLTYVSKGHPIHGPIEDSVFSRYASVFSGKNQTNELREFSDAFKEYMRGYSLNVRYMNTLNEKLANHGFRLFIHDKTCIGYRILDYRIPIEHEGIGDVVFLHKVSICLSMSFLGLSTTNEKDVIISLDDVLDYTETIMHSLSSDRPAVSQAEHFSSIWYQFNTGLSTAEADRISLTLLKKQFAGDSRSQVVNAIIRQVAVHEVKHKWDEVTHADSGWYSLDCEVSAHLAENIHAGVPYYSLLSLINRIQRFYENIESRQVRDMLRPLIRKSWQIAQKAASGEWDEAQIHRALEKIYAAYRPVDGGQLPPLADYYRQVIKPSFSEIPAFEAKPL